MARDVTANMIAQLEADVLQPFLAVKLDFDGDPIRVWTGNGNITINSEDYFGTGSLLSVDRIAETASVQANGANVSLSGVPTDLLSVALNENYQGRDAIIYLGTLSGGAVVTSPYAIFKGFIDTMILSETGATSTITLATENRLIALEVAKVRRYTSEDQKIDFPDDKGFDFVAGLQDKEIVWGT